MTPEAHLAHLEAEVERMLAAAADVLDEPVAACPGWSVADLLAHQSGVYRFVVAQLRAEPGSGMARFDPPGDGPPLEVLRAIEKNAFERNRRKIGSVEDVYVRHGRNAGGVCIGETWSGHAVHVAADAEPGEYVKAGIESAGPHVLYAGEPLV